MIRNIDRLRSEGVMVSGNWLNKAVLMFKEAIYNSNAGKLGFEQAEAEEAILNLQLEPTQDDKKISASRSKIRKDKVVAKQPIKKAPLSAKRFGKTDVISSKHLRSAKRDHSSKRGILGKPSGYEISTVTAQSPAKPVKALDSSLFLDQDINPFESKFELTDTEGQKYLNYKSVSGMDLVPRLRNPTPPRVRDDPEDHEELSSCEKCCVYKKRCETLLEENREIRDEMEKLADQVRRLMALGGNGRGR